MLNSETRDAAVNYIAAFIERNNARSQLQVATVLRLRLTVVLLVILNLRVVFAAQAYKTLTELSLHEFMLVSQK